MYLSYWRQRSIVLSFLGTIVLLNIPAAAEFSVWRGDFGYGHFISYNVCLIVTIF